MEKSWTPIHSLGLAIILGLMPFLTWWSLGSGHTLFSWLSNLALVTGFMAIVGHGILGQWRGVLIDNRNVISLSRLQLVIWTVLVLSGFFTGALWNLLMGLEDALTINVPTELWILMGISTTSLVGSPLIMSIKKEHDPDETELDATKKSLLSQGEESATIDNKGLILVNTDPKLARWSDMFTGDETGNGAHVDMAKVQMFFFTLIVAIAYGTALGKMFVMTSSGGFNSFPNLDQSLLSLIGISHAGYLTSKGTTHSQKA